MQVDRVKRNWSMQNLLRPEDIVFWEAVDPDAVKAGDLVVLVESDQRLCVHRALGNGRSKGDWMKESDPQPMTAWSQCGRVLSIQRGKRTIWRAGTCARKDRWTASLSVVGEQVARKIHIYLPIRMMMRLIWLSAYMRRAV